AGELYRIFTVTLEENPGSPETWRSVHSQNAAAQAGKFGLAQLMIGLSPEEQRAKDLEWRFGAFADLVLARHALVTDGQSRWRLIEEVAKAMDEAAAKLERNARGDYRPDETAKRFPPLEVNRRHKRITLRELYDRWADHPENKGLVPRTKA